MPFEAWLDQNGFDPALMSEGQLRTLKLAWKAETTPVPVAVPAPREDPAKPPAPAPASTFDETMTAIEAENARVVYIQTATQKVAERNIGNTDKLRRLREMCDGAVSDRKVSQRDYDLALLREDRMAGAVVFARGEPEASDSVLEAALCRTGGLPGYESHFPAPVLEAAHKRYKNGLGLSDLVMAFARRGGYKGDSIKQDLRAALRAAFGPGAGDEPLMGVWGPSTSGGLSGILSNTANKFMRSGFDAVDQSWRAIAARRNLTDFKAVSSYALTGGLTFLDLPPGGEIKHGILGAEAYSLQLATQARMIGIDRTQLINDDLGALTQVSRKLGRGGALGVNKKFWTLYVNNSTFYTAGRNNLLTGAGSALSITGLDAAYQKFMAQTDPDGEPLGATPAILMVPPALESTAQQILNSTLLNQQPTGGVAMGSANVWAGRLRLVVSPYLSNPNYTGWSATAWFILDDPEDMATVEVGFLNGNETPIVESADAEFNQLGIALRGYFDWGVSFVEYRAGVKSSGV